MDNERKPNPLIDGEDYFAEYNESIKKNYNKEQAKYIELVNTVFNNPPGREWLEMVKSNLGKTFVELHNPNAQLEMASLQGSRGVIFTIEKILTANEVNQNK